MNDFSGIAFLGDVCVFRVIDIKCRTVAKQQIRITSENPMLLFTIGRDVRVQKREVPYIVKTNGLFLVPPGSITYLDAMQGSAQYYMIEFQTDISQNAGRRAVKLFMGKISFQDLEAVFPDGGADLIRRFQRIVEIWNSADEEKTLGVLGEFYGILYECVKQSQKNASRKTMPQDTAERTRRYLDQHYTESNSIQMLAEVMGVGRTTLYEQFRRATGVSPQQYLTNLRLQAARKALLETDLSIQEIAPMCGLNNTNYFFKLFRAQFGQTPGEYRALHSDKASLRLGLSGNSSTPARQGRDGRKLLVSNFGRIHHYRTIPSRIVCLDYSAAEIIAMLGVAGSITGLAEAEESLEDCLPEARQALEGIPLLAQQSVESRVPSYETILACRPELVVGTSYSFYEQSGIADAGRFERDGIHVYAMKATYTLNSTLEDVYEDIETLGRILAREQEAEKVVADMRTEAASLASRTRTEYRPTRVFVFDDMFGDQAFTCGQSIENHMIAKAGGVNVFGDIQRQFALVDWQRVVQANPQVILVHSFFGKEDGKRKIAHLQAMRLLSDVDAIQNHRIYPLGIKCAFPGIGNVRTIARMMEWFHGDIKEKLTQVRTN